MVNNKCLLVRGYSTSHTAASKHKQVVIKNKFKIKKAFIYLHHYGIKEFLIHVRERIKPYDIDYGTWYEKNHTSEEELEAQRKHAFFYQPLISIVVPVYNTPSEYLKQMMESVIGQTYGKWELCIANANPSCSNTILPAKLSCIADKYNS